MSLPSPKLFPRELAKFIIIIYQKTLSFDHSFLGKALKPQGQCRFFPTCSDYALIALDRHGLFRGLFLAAKRLTRCHPWTKGGYDPVK
ncbi:membrane protein insertion efficiency factor YidD [Candidatus Kuenenbacteria bacterium]|nr:membrane protein insertion efficiency factor YidD [Candidatus Kuenenbacteria bacterium]